MASTFHWTGLLPLPGKTLFLRRSAEKRIEIIQQSPLGGSRPDRTARRKTSPVKGLDGDRRAAYILPSLNRPYSPRNPPATLLPVATETAWRKGDCAPKWTHGLTRDAMFNYKSADETKDNSGLNDRHDACKSAADREAPIQRRYVGCGGRLAQLTGCTNPGPMRSDRTSTVCPSAAIRPEAGRRAYRRWLHG